ncbi:NAD(P)-dependent oxidoreductase [Henriciella mobilis]|nr:NAD(P)-dependent oxidoreductase [Henriciella mobilis]
MAYAGPDLALKGIRPFLDALVRVPSLQWLQTCAAGVEDPVYASLARQGVKITNNHATAPAIAEYVMASALDYLQRGGERRDAAMRREWCRLFFREVKDSKWFIIGLGAIGREVAIRARAFGAHLTAVRRDRKADSAVDRVVTYDNFMHLLPEADVIVITTALTEQTRDLVDREFLDHLSAGKAVLINVARGQIVDEEALREGLQRAQPDFACLDVFAAEPLQEDSWLWAHPKVGVTAHAAALGSGVVARSDDLFLENLHRQVAGKALLNDVTSVLHPSGVV